MNDTQDVKPEGDRATAATLERALMLACERIADSAQSYEEANTAEGWFEVFVKRAASPAAPC